MNQPLPKDCDAIMTPLDQSGRLNRLNSLFREILPGNRFQQARFGNSLQLKSAPEFLKLPFLEKRDLAEDFAANPPFGTNLAYPLEKYTRFHQTSGTTGNPMRILDTEQSWDWWGRCWMEVYKAANVTAKDRLFFAFSFAPSVGFWSSYKAGEMLGAMLIPSGGASTEQRLRMIQETGATVLLGTPSYALRLAEVAKQQGINLQNTSIQTLIHAGEPGASIPQTRRQLEDAWGARVFDHSGATEVGAWGIGDREGRGIYVNEDEFIAEVIDQKTGEPTPPGELGELVITNLDRAAWPVIRYRTGDVVRPRREAGESGNLLLLLEGGILGRADDMIIVRGMNVFPSALENIIREVGGSSEFRITARRKNQLDELEIELEADPENCSSVSKLLRERIGIRVEVQSAEPNSLPRWEGKNKRFVDARNS